MAQSYLHTSSTTAHAEGSRPAVARVLSIAGTDPTGGAGLHADLKSIAAAGGYGMGVVTSLVVQNTRGVQEIHTPDPEFLTAQLRAVSNDVVIDAVKIGMIADAPSTQAVIDWLDELPEQIPVVVDPVMVASSGHALAESISGELLRRATIITPNLIELAQLVQEEQAGTRDEMVAQAQRLAAFTGVQVVAKGGHLSGEDDRDNLLVDATGIRAQAPSPVVHTTAAHGTGCSLSSAIATRLGAGYSAQDAVAWATAWVREALENGEALQVGSGNGPIDHFHRLRRQAEFSDQRPRVFRDVPAPQAVVAPAGPHTERLWSLTGHSLHRFGTEGFIPALVNATLDEEQFRFYIGQDDYYLSVYGSVLARLASLAENPDERRLWVSSALTAIEVEEGMHALWNGDEPTEPSPVTLAYTDFLRAEMGSDYVVAVAAVLPCFWLYAQLAAFVPEKIAEDHPYRPWLETYRDEEFQWACAEVVGVAEKLLDAASDSQRAAAERAFWRACVLEADFFAQATLIDER
ncbi:bifunctional hydroxymethylpyrimidine kinase/phosphomethylpyrimidine kinase [Rothia sp. LK2588]|uniref:bifunctional hydroxymethylpyrimidine kinase/phosphomethylpyrimidine kinase n=1 Tax=Rothia sp. LK2588 TaxID=3114369 RepID=UPI0034CFF7C3